MTRVPNLARQYIHIDQKRHIELATKSSSCLRHHPPMKKGHSDPKRRNVKFRRPGITQKEEYNIKSTAKI